MEKKHVLLEMIYTVIFVILGVGLSFVLFAYLKDKVFKSSQWKPKYKIDQCLKRADGQEFLKIVDTKEKDQKYKLQLLNYKNKNYENERLFVVYNQKTIDGEISEYLPANCN